MRNATIVGGAYLAGHEQVYRTLLPQTSVLIAADSGAALCHRLGRTPDYLVGDLDSIPEDTLRWIHESAVRIRKAPVHKDMTDLDLALDCAREARCQAVTIIGAWSGRLDHTIAAIATAASAKDLVVDLADPGLAGWMLRADLRPSIRLGPAGSLCSLFAPEHQAVVSTAGMRYPLDEGIVPPRSSLGVSNVIDSDEARITVHEGAVLVLSNPGRDGMCAVRLG